MKKVLAIMVTILVLTDSGFTQRRRKNANSSQTKTYSSALYEGMKWRQIGPFRGGRSAAVAGVPGKPTLFYMGATEGATDFFHIFHISHKTDNQ